MKWLNKKNNFNTRNVTLVTHSYIGILRREKELVNNLYYTLVGISYTLDETQ